MIGRGGLCPIAGHVALGATSFSVCFAAWGLIGAFAPRFREIFHLTPSEAALLIAVPVLLGSLARIPMDIFHRRWLGSAGPHQRALPRVALEMKSGQLVAVLMEGEDA